MQLPKLTLNFKAANLPSSVSLSRIGSTATRVNASGLVESVSADVPRFDYDPITLSCRGLLIEDPQTNALTYSEDIANAAWTKTRASISSNAVVAPDGMMTGDKFIEDATASSTHLVQRSVSFASGITATFSVYAKASERGWIRLLLNAVAAGDGGAYFDLNAGNVGTVSGGFATITDVGSGWYRCAITGTTSTTNPLVRINLATSNGGQTYTGDGASGVFLWGAQFELSANATSYIPTEAATVTRNADVATITGADFIGFWRDGKGSALVRARPSTISGVRPVLQFDDATADNIISLRGNAANPELYVRTGGVDQAQIDAGAIAANAIYRLAGAWATNDCAASFNSGTPVLDGVATIPTVTQARLGSDGTNYLNGHLEAVEYYDGRVLSASLQVVSSTAGYRSIIGPAFRDAIIS